MGRRSVVIDLLGPYVEAPPRDVALPDEGSGVAAPPDLRLETGVAGRSGLVGRRRTCTGACSVVVHTVGMVAAVALPILLSSTLPEPAGAVHAFLVEPLSLPPPPPPPPPPATRARAAPVRPQTPPPSERSFVAPVEVPSELSPDEGLDLGIEGGVAGGVEGGVPGGVIGGIVGGLPDSVSAPPPPEMQPIRVGSGLVHEPRKVKYVPPVYPDLALRARLEASVVVEASLDVQGRVVDAFILQGNPVFDQSALEAVRQWAYTPTLLDGVPVPVILTVTVHFRLLPPGLTDP